MQQDTTAPSLLYERDAQSEKWVHQIWLHD